MIFNALERNKNKFRRQLETSVLLNIFLVLALTVLYFILGKFGLSLAFVNASASAVWPPTGVFLALMLLFGFRIWPSIFAGAFLVNFTTAGTWWTSAGIAAGNTLEALAASFLILRFMERQEIFNRAAHVFKYVLFVAATAAMSAWIGNGSLWLGGIIPSHNFLTSWITWFMGDFVSALILTPLILIWSRSAEDFQFNAERVAEFLALLVSTFLACQVIFNGWMRNTNDPLAHFCIVFLLWGVFRFGRHGASAIIFIMSGIALYGTLQGLGPFYVQEFNRSLIFAQAFAANMTITGLILAAVLYEQRQYHEEKSNFISAVSHELRTPLAAIKNSMDILRLEITPQLNSQQKDFFVIANKNAERLIRFINTALDIQKLSVQRMPLECKELDLKELLEDAGKTMEPALREKNLRLTVQVSPDLSKVPADRDRLTQVLINLLDNAVKFTENGSIILSAEPGRRSVWICVSDTGIGIKRKDIAKLFRPFSQIRGESGKKIRGTGLGLNISKKIIEQHGGKMWIESEFGKGSKFYISLPSAGRK